MKFIKPLVKRGSFYPFNVTQSCRFFSAESTELQRNPSDDLSGGTEYYKQTVSCWLKRSALSTSPASMFFGNYGDSSNWGYIGFGPNDELTVYEYLNPTDYGKTYKAKFRDPTAWMHVCVILDMTQATASDRIKAYINGELLTEVLTDYGDPPLNHTSRLSYGDGSTYRQLAGAGRIDTGMRYFDGYLAEYNVVGDQDVTIDDFGQFKQGIWVPKRYTGNYGTNGFYLNFSNSSDFGEDFSGNNNDFVSTNLVAADQMLDTPTNNCCTLNPAEWRQSANITILDGALTTSQLSSNDWMSVFGAWTLESGKWYFEADILSVASTGSMIGATAAVSKQLAANQYPAYTGCLGTAYQANGNIWLNGSTTASVATYTAGDVIGVAIDMDNETISYYKNGVLQYGGLGITSEDQGYVPAIGLYTVSNSMTLNFGQQAFSYSPPSGYKALSADSLLEPAIVEGSQVMDIALWTGDGSASRNITELNFEPDMVWAKDRDASISHRIMDAVRGDNLNLYSDVNTAEQNVTTETTNGGLGTTLSNGFTLVSGTATCDALNTSGHDVAGWAFRAGQKFGFDIVPYTGDGVAGHNISHSLGAVPELIIVKDLDAVQSWYVYHHHALTKTDPETDHGILDVTDAWADLTGIWNDTAPTASVFTVGNSIVVNSSGQDYIAYLFRSIPGFSKIFSYEGNSVVDGPYVHFGFRARYIMIKRADAANSWCIFDTARDIDNPLTLLAYGEAATAEYTTLFSDITANGMKIRNNAGFCNGASSRYIGIAFAENPFKYANAR